MSLFNSQIYKTKNCCHSVDALFNVLSSQHPLSSITASIIFWTHWVPFWLIETRPFAKAEAVVFMHGLLSLLKAIYLSEWYISPAILLFINKYSHATAHYSLIWFLYVTFSVKQPIDPGENILTHSGLPFLVSHIPSWFHCIDCHQNYSSVQCNSVWKPYKNLPDTPVGLASASKNF